MNKLFAAMYYLGDQLHEYYLQSAGINLMNIEGRLLRSGTQYYLQTEEKENYAIRFIDVNALDLKNHIGANISAEVMDSVPAPEGYKAYCRKIQLL